jgi:hypothetical protein
VSASFSFCSSRSWGARSPAANTAPGARPMSEACGARRLPAKPRLLAAALAHGHAVEAVLDVEPAHGGLRDSSRREPAVRDERAQDERHRRGAVLLADVEDELPLLGGELLGVAAVAPRRRPQRGETARAVGVVPALERGHRGVLGIGGGAAAGVDGHRGAHRREGVARLRGHQVVVAVREACEREATRRVRDSRCGCGSRQRYRDPLDGNAAHAPGDRIRRRGRSALVVSPCAATDRCEEGAPHERRKPPARTEHVPSRSCAVSQIDARDEGAHRTRTAGMASSFARAPYERGSARRQARWAVQVASLRHAGR